MKQKVIGPNEVTKLLDCLYQSESNILLVKYSHLPSDYLRLIFHASLFDLGHRKVESSRRSYFD